MLRTPLLLRAALAAVVVLTLVGCTNNTTSNPTAGATAGRATTVLASDTACELAHTEFEAGTTTFSIKNDGSQVTEVYVYAEGDRIIGEKENIGPGMSYDLTVQLQPGSYEVACKPGMVGDGIRQTITVTG